MGISTDQNTGVEGRRWMLNFLASFFGLKFTLIPAETLIFVPKGGEKIIVFRWGTCFMLIEVVICCCWVPNLRWFLDSIVILCCCKSRWLPKKQSFVYMWINPCFCGVAFPPQDIRCHDLGAGRYFPVFLERFSGSFFSCGQMVNPQFSLGKHVWLKLSYVFVFSHSYWLDW